MALPAPIVSDPAAQLNFESLNKKTVDLTASVATVTTSLTGKLNVPAGTMTVVTLAIGTARKPNLSRPTLVVMNVAAGPQSGSTGVVTIRMDSAATPTTAIAVVSLSQVAATVANATVPVTFMVPVGFSYIAVQTAGTGGSIASLSEYTL